MNNLWMAEWHSKNELDGEKHYLMFDKCLPAIFRTRRACREWIKSEWGYIKKRITTPPTTLKIELCL